MKNDNTPIDPQIRSDSSHPRHITTALTLLVAGCLLLPENSVENRNREPLKVESISIEDGATDIAKNASVEIRFNQPLDPASLDNAKMTLTSGTLNVSADLRFDALTRTLVFDPRSNLRENLWYTFEMEEFPLSIMGTAYLDEPIDIDFRTGTETMVTTIQRGVSFDDDIWPVLSGNCSCHGEDARAMNYVIHADPDAFLESSVATTSREWPGWRVIDPGDHAYSYIIFKLLGDERLGMPTILGEPMPPGAPLPMQDIENMRDWIEQGAGR